MKYSLIIKPEAELDMLKSSKWYEEKQNNLGLRFLDEAEELLKLHWEELALNKEIILSSSH